ncbi:uncharacterized protein MELLADRAFT_78240 [Melampsora larici-populina 98AG31]|uniref:Uncharacterized protein n=1 Tax=Melampsora larici-populina (strain 98AG31 / pathotype 3-4-7) TaxID=747676 RepID=F4RRW2_MELLP|nr:uncharacterized protein MELLADRAFT_78240 [Melampsora larici-populina 98AG31]EGG04748.1 hypothetical protein MELLADRAFT_78240 [Melampsora larici-populina 98AG31]
MTLNSSRSSSCSSSSEIEIINQSKPKPSRLPSSPSSTTSSPKSNPTLNQHSQLNTQVSILIESSDDEPNQIPVRRTNSTPNPIRSNPNPDPNPLRSHSNHETSTKEKGKSKAIELSDTDEDRLQDDPFDYQHDDFGLHMNHPNNDDDDELPEAELLFSQETNSFQRPVSRPLQSFQSTSNPTLKEKTKETKKTSSSVSLVKKNTKANQEIEKLKKKEQLQKEKEAKKLAKDQEKAEAKDLKDVNKLLTRQEAITEIRLKVPSRVLLQTSHPISKSIDLFKSRIQTEEGNKMSMPILDETENESIQWIRVCQKEWNESTNRFEPCERKEIVEECLLLVWKADELDDWISDGNGEHLMRAKSIREDKPEYQVCDYE